jgi:CTP synthase
MRLGGKDVEVKTGTLAAKLFDNARRIRLRFRHRYEVDPKFIPTLEEKGLVFSGKHPAQPIMQILELPQDKHPYFIGTQAHPELTSRPLRPSPFFMGLVRAAAEHAGHTVDEPPKMPGAGSAAAPKRQPQAV